MKAERWANGIRQTLGREPRTSEEALRALGAFLRANPTEKGEFLREAHEVWVKGASWEIRDRSPVAVVVLVALEEATRRLAELHGWKRKREDKPAIRVTGDDVWSQRIRVRVVSNPRGEGVDFWFSGEINQKVLWAAAFAVAQGKQICVAVPSSRIGEKVKRMIATRAARVAKQSGDKYLTPWGKEIPLLPGDRWEHPDWYEPRIAEAVRALREILGELEEDTEPEGDRGPWAHQTRLPTWAIRAILENQGEDLEGVGWEYLHLLEREALEALDSLTLNADVYYEGDLRSLLGHTPRSRRRAKPWFSRWVRGVPTYGEVLQDWKDFFEVRETKKGDKEIWYWGKMAKNLAPIIAHKVVLMGFGDPEFAFYQTLHKVLGVAQKLRKRKKWAEINPIAILTYEAAHHLSELRSQEQGIFRLSEADAQALREYFAKLSLGETPELPGHLRRVLEDKDYYSVELLRDYGVEPSEEVDYDQFLLRRKVAELIEEVKLLWGDPGLAFVEALMDGATPEGAQIRSGLPRAQTDEIVAHLRQELEGWAD
ncbi:MULTISPECIES: hypothetical protein [Thermus]|uniref:hypothetical protein n=1 Tax=Thermus brockianus TaxID=56956 RepID=UPI001F4147CD|nr:hypothetical protein [Thermus brockianus]